MRISLITTTINVPSIVDTYASLHEDLSVVVAGDKKTPHQAVRDLFGDDERLQYLDPEDQIGRSYRCSELIGWNSIQRRNIALIEAISQNSDFIVTVDDDNYPVNDEYFNDFEQVFSRPFTGLSGRTHDDFFDIGQTYDPAFFHRGSPYDIRKQTSELSFTPVKGARIGIAEGLWLGDPDIDAATRLVVGPTAKQISDVARNGVVADSNAWTVFNTQNTAFLTELAPLMMVWPGIGRYDDIWASYAAQRVMRDSGLHIYFGNPLIWQERNPQDIVKNLRDETYGMEHTPRFLRDLEQMELSGSDYIDQLKSLFQQLRPLGYVPSRTLDVGEAWCEDVYDVLKAN